MTEGDELPARSKQEQLQEGMMRLEMIKSQLEGLSQQGEIFELTATELQRAKETLTSLKDIDTDADADKEILIPIGGDTFIYANVTDVKKILIGVGANTIIEQDMDQAIEKLDSRLDNLTKASQNIFQSITTLQQQATDLNSRIQELSREIQGQV
jgi:prefoldin alpha subunit